MNNTNTKQVLIIGGGFAGIKTALELCKDDQFSITLLTDNPNFRYNPTLYHTATGGIRGESNIPLASLFQDKSVNVVEGKAIKLDRSKKAVHTTDGQAHHYDMLVLALGMVTNYFGIKGMPEYSYGIKSLDEAIRFKKHLHQQLIDEHQPDLNYIIVGGGPTGIELAGALPEYLHHIMRAHGIKHKAIHIDLVEASPHLVPRLPKRMGTAIERQLRHSGVKLYLGKSVGGETADTLMIDGQPLPSHTVVWTAGMANAPFYKENDFKLSERGKVLVDQYLQAEPDIYVLGDNNNTQYSGMAQTALHDAACVSQNLIRQANGKKPRSYKPKKPIYVMPAGPKWAAVLWGNIQLYGRIGWMLRSVADLIAFHDIEPWWAAAEQWVTEFSTQEECPTCATGQVEQ
jgi:NADH:ubiquinone reductase (H+-translocating)